KNSEKYLIYETNEKIANIYSTFKDYEKAIEIYEDLLDETKNLYTHNLPILYFRMGYNYYMANKYKEALVNLKKIDKNSDYYEIGQSYIEEIKKKS
ncbi:MAG: tetratricopeptide repeat protein, partial [Cetobacterium sp.]